MQQTPKERILKQTIRVVTKTQFHLWFSGKEDPRTCEIARELRKTVVTRCF